MIFVRAFACALGVLLLAGCAGSKPAPADDAEVSITTVRERAALAWQYGNFSDAVAANRELLRREPGNRDALIGLGDAWLALGNAERALGAFDELLKAAPEDVDALEGRSLALLGMGRHEDAAQGFAAVESRAPGRWRTQNGLGLLADLRADYAAAGEFYRRGISANPGEASVWNNHGWSRVMARDYVEAERVLVQALARKPGSPRINANLAVAIAWQGDYQRALMAARRTAEEHVAYNDVGYIAMLRGDLQLAASYFQKAIDLSPVWFERAAANLERVRRAMAVASPQ